MELFILVFLLLIRISVSNQEKREKYDEINKRMMSIKYPFNIYMQESYVKLMYRAVYGHRLDVLEFPNEKEFAEKLIVLNKDCNTAKEECDRLEEELLRAIMHNRGYAYIPKGMNTGNIYQTYPEYALINFKSMNECNEHLRVFKPGKPKHPDIWESEKEWLREYQRSEEVVRRWNERAAEIGYYGGYKYNPEDKKRMHEEAKAAKAERRQARRKERTDKRRQQREDRSRRLF